MSTWIVFTLLCSDYAVSTHCWPEADGTVIDRGSDHASEVLFGLPFALLYFFLLWRVQPGEALSLDSDYFIPASLAALSQIIATLCLVKALTLRNFAVGTALAKTEAIMTALLGALSFAASLSALGYVSVVVGVLGVLVASNWRIIGRICLETRVSSLVSVRGSVFALASLWIRQASLSLGVAETLSAAAVLVYMVALQTLICLMMILLQQRQQLALIADTGVGRCLSDLPVWQVQWLVYCHEPAGSSAG